MANGAPSFDPRACPLAPAELAGRVICITGVTGGIGQALALDCASHGAQLILCGRNTRKLELLHADVCAATRSADRASAVPSREPLREPLIAPLDLEKALAQDYDGLADAVLRRFGRLDGLVHCAALLGALAPIEQFDVPTWYRVMHVNVTAAFALTRVLLPALRAAADASVLFTTSSVGRRGRAYWGAYAVSKFAIEGLTQVLADELESSGVRVNAINPGRARTAMRRQAFPSEALESLPLPAALTAPYIALLGAAARGVTGRSFDAQA